MHAVAIIICGLGLVWAGFVFGYLLAVRLAADRPKPQRQKPQRIHREWIDEDSQHYVAVWSWPEDRAKSIWNLHDLYVRMAEETVNAKASIEP